MKPTAWIVVLIGVFFTATVVTALALTLFASPVASVEIGFVGRLSRNALHFGWAAGFSVTAVFVLLRRKFINLRQQDVPNVRDRQK